MLLPRLLAGRREGPVFLSSRKPGHVVASGDLCPVTRRARLGAGPGAPGYHPVHALLRVTNRVGLPWQAVATM